jgi:DNA-binding response OmpR family regulator
MPYSVLILEDEPNLIRLFSKALRKSGFQVTTAMTLDDARQRLLEQRFDVMLCDMRVGSEQGIDLLREQQPLLESQNTKLIIVSAEEQYASEVESLGIRVFLAKPVLPNSLARIVQNMLGTA